MSENESFGEYRVLEVLGHGAMGLVYRARDPRLDRLVALKIVHPGRVSKDATKARSRLVAEARALARIAHPNVLAVYDVGVQDDLVYVALELIDGIDLAQWLRARTRPWTDVVAVFVEAASGLAAVHDAGLVHRDVKPANILVEHAAKGFGRVLVADFGIARAETDAAPNITIPGDVASSSDDDASLTEEGRVVGTPAYMAPEQHIGLDATAAADQYALCVALYEALYRKRPFFGDAPKLLQAKTTPPTEPPPSDVPTWLWAIVRRGLSPLPRDRFPTMTDLLAALRAGEPRRRRYAATAVVGVAIVGAVAVLSLASDRPCRDIDAQVTEIWNARRRAEIEAAFTDSDRPYAAPTWARASDRIDAYARELAAMYREACEVDRTQSEAHYDRRLACLDRRRQQLAQSLAVLASTDAVDHADAVVTALAPVAPCGDAVALAAGVAPPSEAQREAVADVRRMVADADAMQAGGRYDDAAATSDAAVEQARALDYPPALVEALAIAGECYDRVGRLEDARAVLEEAVAIGLQIGHDEFVARAVVMRTWLAGEAERDLAAAEKWGALGRAQLQRIGEPPRLSLHLENALGASYSNADRFDAALQAYERALGWAGADPDLAMTAAAVHSNLGNVWRLRGDYERAQQSYERALMMFSERLGEDHPNVARTQARVAQLLDLRGLHREAAASLRRAVVSLERTHASPADLASALIDLGVALRAAGMDEEANATYARAIELTSEDDFMHAYARLAYGQACIEQGIYDAAEVHFKRAIELFEGMGSNDGNLGMALIGLGDVRFAQDNVEEALSLYRRAKDQIGATEANSRVAARALASIALVHHDAGRHDEAVAALDQHDAIVAAVPYLLPDQRFDAAVQRVRLMVDAGRVDEAAAAVDTLETILAEARRSGGSRWLGEGTLVLARARLARGELEAGCALLAGVGTELTQSPALLAQAQTALASCP